MPVKRPNVAVLLAAYNGASWIEEQMASILSQTDVDLTIYISIDPSTDGTEALCQLCAERNPGVVVLPEVGKFGGASRNFFRLIRDVNLSAFDFVAFADQDDIWHLDKLHRATQTLQNTGADGYSSNVTAFWPDGRTELIDKAQPQVKWDYLFEAAGPGCTYVLSRPLFEMLKASVKAHWETLQAVSLHDWYCYAFARSHGFTWVIDPAPSMEYRQHERNQFGANTGFRSLAARFNMIRGGWWFSQVQLIAELVGTRSGLLIKAQKPLGRWALVRLSLHAWDCRRRGRDKVFLFCVCWVGAVMGFG
jgi:rhamnosyltransferase